MENIILFYEQLKRALSSDEGIGTVELVLVLFVLIGVVIIFKNNISTIVEDYFTKMDPNFVHPTVK